ncbi:MAG: hypothetical protein AAGA68_05395 [Pseudomonadota bacterium]
MIYLLAKFTLIYLLIAIIAFVLGYWWCRRRFVDYTEHHAQLTEALADRGRLVGELQSQLKALEQSVASTLVNRLTPLLPSVDLAPLEDGVGELRQQVDQLRPALAPIETHVSALRTRVDEVEQRLAPTVAPLEKSLLALDARVAALPVPPPATNLTPLQGALDALCEQVASLPAPEPVDLSSVHEAIASLSAQIRALPAPKEVDLRPLGAALDAVSAQVEAIPVPPAVELAPLHSAIEHVGELIAALPAPEHVDLAPVRSGIDRVAALVAALPAPERLDLSPVHADVERVASLVAALPTPDRVDLAPMKGAIDRVAALVQDLPAPTEVDLGPIRAAIERVTQLVEALPAPQRVDLQPLHGEVQRSIALIEALPAPLEVDLSAVFEEFSRLDTALRSLPIPPAVDVLGLQRQIEALSQAVDALPPPAESIDLSPVLASLAAHKEVTDALPSRWEAPLAALQARVDALPTTFPEVPDLSDALGQLRELIVERCQPAAQAPREEEAARAEARLLTAADFGAPDELQRISGVGPVLEKLLHGQGVFYFWQIAAWSPRDVAFVDSLLEVFQGRIERDEWVAQAAKLMREPGAAQAPDDARP